MPSRFLRNLIKADSEKSKRLCLVQYFADLCAQDKLSEALESLRLLAQKGIRLDTRSLFLLLQSCCRCQSLSHAKSAHHFLKVTGLKRPTTFLANQLINVYVKCGSFNDARKLFVKMRDKNIFSWNAMLAGYTKAGMINEAMAFFNNMPERDVISWNTLLIALARNGLLIEAVSFYNQMRRLAVGYSHHSFAGIIITCVKTRDISLTQQVHAQVLISGLVLDLVLASSLVDAYGKNRWIHHAHKLFTEMPMKDVMAWTTLISGYAKLGDLHSANKLFVLMPEKNAVSWTSLIAGYAQHGMWSTALELFAKMMKARFKPNNFTYSSCLCACGSIASLRLGKQIHAHLIRVRFLPSAVVTSTLIDMYSKCGDLDSCRHIFNNIANRHDIILWNTMISSLVLHGQGNEAVEVFEGILNVGLKPNEITFHMVLTTCSHSTLVAKGIKIYKSMGEHKFIPQRENYSCLVELLGREGFIHKTEEYFESDRTDVSLYDNAELQECGEKATECFLGVMSALSWIDVHGKQYAFGKADELYPHKQEIYEVLEQMTCHLEGEAYLV